MKISSLSTYDVIALQATFYYLTEERFNCEQKIEEYAKKTDLERAKRLVYTVNGCDKIDEKPRYEIDNIKYHTCFCQFKHSKMLFFYNLYEQYQKGVLPFKGSLVDQPNYIMEVFSLLNKLTSERQQEEIKKQKAEDGRRQHRHRAGNQSVQRGVKRK